MSIVLFLPESGLSTTRCGEASGRVPDLDVDVDAGADGIASPSKLKPSGRASTMSAEAERTARERDGDRVVDIGAATVVGAALRAERRWLSDAERSALIRRLSNLELAGDATAALIRRRLQSAIHKLPRDS